MVTGQVGGYATGKTKVDSASACVWCGVYQSVGTVAISTTEGASGSVSAHTDVGGSKAVNTFTENNTDTGGGTSHKSGIIHTKINDGGLQTIVGYSEVVTWV